MSTAASPRPAPAPSGSPALGALTVNAVLIAVRQAANVLCDRWSLLTLLLAHAGVHRFNEFSARGGMASRLLTSRLEMLEAQEILVRLPYSRRPPRYDYHLTHMGLELFDVFATLVRWERTWHPPAPGAAAGVRIEHIACGTPSVLPVPHCAACDAVIQSRDIWLTVSQREIEQMQVKPTAYRRSTLSTTRQGGGAPVPLPHAIDVFGDKWSIELVMCLFTRVHNFNDFQSHLGISTNILSDRLARLLALGILRQATEVERYGKGAYALTDKGIDLHPVLLAIQAWADKWLRERYRSPVKFTHRPCGKPLRLRVGCDACGEVLARANSRFVLE